MKPYPDTGPVIHLQWMKTFLRSRRFPVAVPVWPGGRPGQGEAYAVQPYRAEARLAIRLFARGISAGMSVGVSSRSSGGERRAGNGDIIRIFFSTERGFVISEVPVNDFFRYHRNQKYFLLSKLTVLHRISLLCKAFSLCRLEQKRKRFEGPSFLQGACFNQCQVHRRGSGQYDRVGAVEGGGKIRIWNWGRQNKHTLMILPHISSEEQDSVGHCFE